MTAPTMMEHFEEFRALMKQRFDDRDHRDVVVILDGVDELPEEQRSEISSRIYTTKSLSPLLSRVAMEWDCAGSGHFT